MDQHFLTPLFAPTSVAIFAGPADDPEQLTEQARQLHPALRAQRFTGTFRFIDIRATSGTLADLASAKADLAIIALPFADIAPAIELASRMDCTAVMVLSSGISAEQAEVLHKVADQASVYLLGPNGLGIQRPPSQLNASVAGPLARSGSLALVSQSGSLTSSMLDWAASNAVGFSSVVSLGPHSALDIADVLDFLAADRQTHSIIIYMEGIHNARRFMSALRSAATAKPVVILKAGRNTGERANHIIEAHAPSAARVVYNHYGGKARFPRVTDEMMAAVDQADSAQYSREDILDPQGWVLLNYLMDSRTGLGRFREFRISNYQLMMDLIKYCRDHTIAQILALPDVQERVTLYFDHAARAKEQILRCATQHGNLVVLDLRAEETIWAVNRFMIYALFPTANISIHVMWGVQKQNTVFATGKSILDRSSQAHVGNLLLELGGRGNANVGPCQLPNDKADVLLQTLVQRITAEG